MMKVLGVKRRKKKVWTEEIPFQSSSRVNGLGEGGRDHVKHFLRMDWKESNNRGYMLLTMSNSKEWIDWSWLMLSKRKLWHGPRSWPEQTNSKKRKSGMSTVHNVNWLTEKYVLSPPPAFSKTFSLNKKIHSEQKTWDCVTVWKGHCSNLVLYF